jgi:signal transduction histidine kinase
VTEPPSTARRLSVQAWLMTALAAMGALAVIAAIVGTTVLAHATNVSNHLNTQVAPARTKAADLQAELDAQQSAVRGYVLLGGQAMVDDYDQAVVDQSQTTAQLNVLLGYDAPSLADLSAVEQAANTWRGQFAVPAVTAVQRHQAPPLARDTPDFQAVQTRLGILDTHLVQQNDQATQALMDARAERNTAFEAMLAVFLLTAVALALLLHVTVARPLSSMRAAARRVAEGDFEHRIPERGPADLQAMAQAVEAMRRRVVSDLAETREQAQLLREQTAQLDHQAIELRRSNSELEQFAYVASHDLQEPLRKVASFCQMLERRYSDKLDERGLQYIAFAVDGAKRMQVLINDLLTYSRVGRVREAESRIAAGEQLGRAIRNLEGAIEDSGAVIEYPEDLPRVAADPMLLTMLWQNLLGNAVKFRHADRAPRVSVAVRADPQEPGMWQFTVTDNGIGIPPEFADKVFVIFQRLHGRDAYEGTGIGLALCKKIIENSGGRIWIDTGHAGGARLGFTLPGAPDETVPQEAAPPEATPQAAAPHAAPPPALEGTSA